MDKVRAKKHLGQHFLIHEPTTEKIANSYLEKFSGLSLEIGPGMGVLTKYLIEADNIDLFVAEIDWDSVAYLKEHFPKLENKILEGDYLKMNITETFPEKYSIVGNFPYNISSQIFFKILEERNKVEGVVCMLQKEVAKRICSKEGNKVYGILSVFLQTYYDIEYLFTVPPTVFNPPPKVDSGVIRLIRNDRKELGCDEKLFFRLVKQGFNNRRKTLRNALKSLNLPLSEIDGEVLSKRAEQLSVEDFIALTKEVEKHAGRNQ